MIDTEVQNKLAAARTRLILDKPFLGALVLRLPLVAADPKQNKLCTVHFLISPGGNIGLNTAGILHVIML